MNLPLRLVALWAGANAVFCLALLAIAVAGGRLPVPRALGILTAAVLLGLAALGGIASVALWRAKPLGKGLGRAFFLVLALLYSVKLILGPERAAVLLPLGLSLACIGALVTGDAGPRD